MKKLPEIFTGHIIESIELIEEYVKNKTEVDFFSSRQLQDSVIRRLEIIGEAAKNLPSEIKEKNPDIPWKKMAGLRDVLIHEYFGVDLELTWQIIQNDIPVLKRQISDMNIQ